jgi:hypothetical protein
MKPEIYESLHVINAATQQITEHIEKLESAGLLTPHFADIRKLTAQQTCIETSHSAIVALAGLEMGEVAKIEKERIERESRLRS